MNTYQVIGLILLVICVAIAVWGLWPKKYYGTLTIISGRGFGETRNIIGFDGFTFTVDQPWDETPDGTSIYAMRDWP